VHLKQGLAPAVRGEQGERHSQIIHSPSFGSGNCMWHANKIKQRLVKSQMGLCYRPCNTIQKVILDIPITENGNTLLSYCQPSLTLQHVTHTASMRLNTMCAKNIPALGSLPNQGFATTSHQE